MTTLLVTDDFLPRPGGIRQFVHNLAVRRPAGSVVVHGSPFRAAAGFDAVDRSLCGSRPAGVERMAGAPA